MYSDLQEKGVGPAYDLWNLVEPAVPLVIETKLKHEETNAIKKHWGFQTKQVCLTETHGTNLVVG